MISLKKFARGILRFDIIEAFEVTEVFLKLEIGFENFTRNTLSHQ